MRPASRSASEIPVDADEVFSGYHHRLTAVAIGPRIRWQLQREDGEERWYTVATSVVSRRWMRRHGPRLVRLAHLVERRVSEGWIVSDVDEGWKLAVIDPAGVTLLVVDGRPRRRVALLRRLERALRREERAVPIIKGLRALSQTEWEAPTKERIVAIPPSTSVPAGRDASASVAS